MRYSQLRAFHFVAIYSSFSIAAEKLKISQPAVSEQVKKLEQNYDTLLLRRHNKKISLTDTGEKLVILTKQLFEVEQQIEDYISETGQDLKGSIRIIADSASHVLNILAAFRKKYPNWKELHDRKNELPNNYSCPQSFRTPIPEEAYPTAWIGDRAVDYINDSAKKDAPFFAFVSFPDPHHPFNPPGKYWDMYSPDEFSVDLPYSAHKNPTPAMQDVNRMWEAGESGAIPQMAFRASDEHVKETMALTAGMITMIDDQVGRLIQSLKDNGQYDNTVIVFTSDHGDYLGDFNMLLKGPLKLGSITRVPMIWSDPNSRTAVRTKTLGSTIDLSASILERVGFEPYNGMQGKSFLRSLSGDEPRRDEVLIEFNNNDARMGMVTVPRVRTLRSKSRRLSVYADEDWGELYDLENDPNETHNLWNDEKAEKAKLKLSLRLVEHLARQTDSSPRSKRLA